MMPTTVRVTHEWPDLGRCEYGETEGGTSSWAMTSVSVGTYHLTASDGRHSPPDRRAHRVLHEPHATVLVLWPGRRRGRNDRGRFKISSPSDVSVDQTEARNSGTGFRDRPRR